MNKTNEEIIARHILEIRHQPYMKFLDMKGELASIITKLDRFSFQYWSLSDDRVDFMDKSEKIKSFISSTNYGFVIEDSPTLNYFRGQSLLYLKELFKQIDLSDRDIIRIGGRSFFLVDSKESFESIKKKYLERFINLNPEITKIFESNLIDVGAPFNFKEKDGTRSFNTMSGPMEKEQMRQFFNVKKIYPDDKFPDAALYFEIDYFVKDIGKIKNDALLKLINQNIDRSIELFKKFKDYVLK